MKNALALSLSLVLCASADPLTDSWFKVNSGQFARIYTSDADRLANHTVTTWSNGRNSQSQAAYNGVQAVLISRDWVYIRSTGLGSHVMGPWYLDRQRARVFPNLPTDQHLLLQLPRYPMEQQGNRFNPLGEIGMFVDGVSMFDANDSFSYVNSARRDADPRAGLGRGDEIWNRDAYVNEGTTFDAALGHQQNRGRYHYHAEPLALRYLLGDHVDFDSATQSYRESAAPVTKHSPIIGWMRDGYPLYGPYGFASASNATSGLRRMVSGFAQRDGTHGTDDVRKLGRRMWPLWAAREFGGATILAPNEIGPDISERYPLGHYVEDYTYLGDVIHSTAHDWDLDECNGRWCVTPEFPEGTYAYFTTLDASGKPVYPYNMGRRYHGVPSGSYVRSINESVSTNFEAHVASPLKPVSSRPVTLLWKPDESYQAAR